MLLQEVFQGHEACHTGRELPRYVSTPMETILHAAARLSKEAFWRQSLKGFRTPTVLNVGQALGIPFSNKKAYAEQQQRLSAAETAALEWTQQHHLSLNTLVQGAWCL